MQGTSAVLNVMTLPPGATNTQARLVLDGVRGAIFYYTAGGPSGALLVSLARSAGTDPYGNSYPAGLSVSGGAGIITGPDYIFNSSGLFVYSGTPASGNLISSIASAPGTDSFGNAYLAGLTSYGASLSGSGSIASNLNSGIATNLTAPASSGPWSLLSQLPAVSSDSGQNTATTGVHSRGDLAPGSSGACVWLSSACVYLLGRGGHGSLRACPVSLRLMMLRGFVLRTRG